MSTESCSQLTVFPELLVRKECHVTHQSDKQITRPVPVVPGAIKKNTLFKLSYIMTLQTKVYDSNLTQSLNNNNNNNNNKPTNM